jgi:Fic family protein
MEAKGKQDLWIKQKPEVISALREQAIIQSAESSNRIEGVTIEKNRLRPLLIGKSRPKDRPEEEVYGYRNALNWIFKKKTIPVKPETILYLHKLAQGGHTGDAGEWKKKNNEIIELLPNGERKVRFIPASAQKTPGMIKNLCDSYNNLSDEGNIPALILASTFVFDFLCIHPFRDGNGRVSRLLTTMLLQQHGFIAGKFISMERLIEESKEDYYNILEKCSVGWHEGKSSMQTWINYFLSILHRAYNEFAEKIENAKDLGKAEIIRHTVLSRIGPFTLSELSAECPSVSTQMIKKVLSDLKKDGSVILSGKGRGARWEVV